MASSRNSSADPKRHFSLSEAMMDLLDNQRNQYITAYMSMADLTPEQLQLQHAKVQGFSEAVNLIYNNLPEESKHGWTIRRGRFGSQPGGTPTTGGSGEPQENSRRPKRRTKGSRSSWFR